MFFPNKETKQGTLQKIRFFFSWSLTDGLCFYLLNDKVIPFSHNGCSTCPRWMSADGSPASAPLFVVDRATLRGSRNFRRRTTLFYVLSGKCCVQEVAPSKCQKRPSGALIPRLRPLLSVSSNISQLGQDAVGITSPSHLPSNTKIAASVRVQPGVCAFWAFLRDYLKSKQIVFCMSTSRENIYVPKVSIFQTEMYFTEIHMAGCGYLMDPTGVRRRWWAHTYVLARLFWQFWLEMRLLSHSNLTRFLGGGFYYYCCQMGWIFSQWVINSQDTFICKFMGLWMDISGYWTETDWYPLEVEYSRYFGLLRVMNIDTDTDTDGLFFMSFGFWCPLAVVFIFGEPQTISTRSGTVEFCSFPFYVDNSTK